MELRWRPTSQTPRFVLLLAAMLAEILLAPLIYDSPAGVVGARTVTGLMLIASLAAIGVRRTPVIFFVLAGGSHLLAVFRPEEQTQLLAAFVRFVFLVYVFLVVITRVMRERNVTYDTIAGAACGYMLIGMVFGDLLYVNEVVQPGSYEIPASMTATSARDLRAALLYFSLTTLTTVGYGDIHPTNPGAGGLALCEAILGQLYLTVTVARLVGLHLVSRSD